MGRVEVYYQNIWGTVCDNSYDLTDANVICNMLNFTRAACAISNGRIGRGSGKEYLILSGLGDTIFNLNFSYFTNQYEFPIIILQLKLPTIGE